MGIMCMCLLVQRGGQVGSDGGHIETVGDGTTEEVVRKYFQQQGSSREKELYQQLKLFR